MKPTWRSLTSAVMGAEGTGLLQYYTWCAKVGKNGRTARPETDIRATEVLNAGLLGGSCPPCLWGASASDTDYVKKKTNQKNPFNSCRIFFTLPSVEAMASSLITMATGDCPIQRKIGGNLGWEVRMIKKNHIRVPYHWHRMIPVMKKNHSKPDCSHREIDCKDEGR